MGPSEVLASLGFSGKPQILMDSNAILHEVTFGKRPAKVGTCQPWRRHGLRDERAESQALRDAADVLGGMKILVGSLKKSPKSQEAENVVVQ